MKNPIAPRQNVPIPAREYNPLDTDYDVNGNRYGFYMR